MMRINCRWKALIFVGAVFLLLMTLPVRASPESFIESMEPYLPIVQQAGLYPSVFIAQSALETGWGKSDAVKYHNYWGIKCRSSPCFSKQTWEIYDGQYWQGQLLFQAYPDLAAGVQGYCAKINYQREYQDLDRSDRDAFIGTLAKVWATDPDYAWKLTSIIRVWALDKYDGRD